MSGALLALALLLAADPPPAPPPGPPGAAVTVLHLRETAEKSVVPDRLRIEMRVEQSGTDPRNVQSAINRHMAAALAKARQLAGIVVRTGDYTLFQQHPPDTAGPRWTAAPPRSPADCTSRSCAIAISPSAMPKPGPGRSFTGRQWQGRQPPRSPLPAGKRSGLRSRPICCSLGSVRDGVSAAPAARSAA